MAVVCSAVFVAQHSWQQPRDGVDHHGSSDGTIGEHVVSDRELLIDEVIDHPLVDPFIVTTKEDEMSKLRVFCGDPLAKDTPPWGEKYQLRGAIRVLGNSICPDGFDCSEDRLAFHDHPLSAAVWKVIGRLVFSRGPVPDIVMAHIDETPLLSFAEDTFGQRPSGDGGEETENVDSQNGGGEI